ncbi:hypothetical protein [Intestinibacter bartlettii]
MIKVVNPIKNNDCSSNIKDFEVPKFSKAAGAEKSMKGMDILY